MKNPTPLIPLRNETLWNLCYICFVKLSTPPMQLCISTLPLGNPCCLVLSRSSRPISSITNLSVYDAPSGTIMRDVMQNEIMAGRMYHTIASTATVCFPLSAMAIPLRVCLGRACWTYLPRTGNNPGSNVHSLLAKSENQQQPGFIHYLA